MLPILWGVKFEPGRNTTKKGNRNEASVTIFTVAPLGLVIKETN